MAKIIGSKITDKDVTLSIKLSHEESLQLKGNTHDLCLFSLNTLEAESNIHERGKNGSSKFFLIPRETRQETKFNKDILCQKIETKEKIIWVYAMSKI